MISCPEKIQEVPKDLYEIKRRDEKYASVGSGEKIISLEGLLPNIRFIRNEKLRERFIRLSKIWHEDMDGVSSVQLKTSHWAYQEVINLGESAVPYILEETIKVGGGGWFLALAKIMKHNPVRAEHKMSMDKILDDWLTYAKELRLDF